MADALSSYALSTLIGSIYDCALDPSLWEPTLAQARDALRCTTAILHLNDLSDNSRILIRKSVGIPADGLEQMEKHAAEVGARLVEDLASWPSLDEPHVMLRHLPAEYRARSSYIQNVLKPNGIVDVLTLFLMHTPTRLGALGFARHERQGVLTEREIEGGRLLIPHLRRAVTISNVLDVRTIERSRMAEALDALRCAVVMTDERAMILHANRAAERMLRDGGPIQGIGGMLSATAPSAAAELRAAVRLAAQDEVGIGRTGLAIRLTETDAPPVFAHVLPMTGGELRTRLQPAAVAAVFIGAALDEQNDADAIAVAFGLTPAETRTLASFLAGRTLAETADVLGIAATTARSHLDNIFAKTGVSRQAELMRLAAQIVPPTRAQI